MRRILVTGANKGIGLAIVEGILAHDADTFVYLGSRDRARGEEAAAGLGKAHPSFAARLQVLAIDVADDRSVTAATKGVEPLHGIVNNAGIGTGAGDLAALLGTNVLGVQRVCEAFLPLLEPKGRIVNVTSASGPIYVASCSAERQRFFLDPAETWPRLRAFIDAAIAEGDAKEAYGLSKACANLYTLILAREHPHLHINAVTPGFIATDLTRPYFESAGKTAAELGMKTPAEGAKAPLFCLFGRLEGNGHYYGSDAKRSPLDRYRAPGSAEYTGS